ncbi:EexN family lipoprotein [Yersinia enterocolitica]|uniref:EexN family lipoprotein n=1 Tax=Yersinia enterocolitica TaxID=630 RepID=UPI003AB635F4
MKNLVTAGSVVISSFILSGCFEETKSVDWWFAHPKETYEKLEECQKSGSDSDNCKNVKRAHLLLLLNH